jgi:hypothetical protein
MLADEGRKKSMPASTVPIVRVFAHPITTRLRESLDPQ